MIVNGRGNIYKSEAANGGSLLWSHRSHLKRGMHSVVPSPLVSVFLSASNSHHLYVCSESCRLLSLLLHSAYSCLSQFLYGVVPSTKETSTVEARAVETDTRKGSNRKARIAAGIRNN